MADTATEIITIDAPPEQVWDIAVDIANYPSGRTTSRTSRSTAPTTRAGRPRSSSGHRPSAAAPTTRSPTTTSAAPKRLGWTHGAAATSSARSTALFTFEPTEIGGTLVRYDLEIDLAIPLPGFVKRRAEVRILNTVRELKVRAEA